MRCSEWRRTAYTLKWIKAVRDISSGLLKWLRIDGRGLMICEAKKPSERMSLMTTKTSVEQAIGPGKKIMRTGRRSKEVGVLVKKIDDADMIRTCASRAHCIASGRYPIRVQPSNHFGTAPVDVSKRDLLLCSIRWKRDRPMRLIISLARSSFSSCRFHSRHHVLQRSSLMFARRSFNSDCVQVRSLMPFPTLPIDYFPASPDSKITLSARVRHRH
jgi:hypothetical protein